MYLNGIATATVDTSKPSISNLKQITHNRQNLLITINR